MINIPSEIHIKSSDSHGESVLAILPFTCSWTNSNRATRWVFLSIVWSPSWFIMSQGSLFEPSNYCPLVHVHFPYSQVEEFLVSITIAVYRSSLWDGLHFGPELGCREELLASKYASKP